jgi:hypothetical protein
MDHVQGGLFWLPRESVTVSILPIFGLIGPIAYDMTIISKPIKIS